MHFTTQITLSAALFVLAAGCLYDSESPCGENQLHDAEHGACTCIETAIYKAGRCELCPEGQFAVGDACACPEGQVASEEGCVDKPPSLGAACDDDAMTCDDANYPRCEIDDEEAGTGYCTSEGCADNSECGGYTCATWSSPSICQRPPTGLGESCADSEDCADFEADLCGAPLANVCLVQGCDLELGDCPAGYTCCDLSAFPPLTTVCAPGTTCPF